MRIELSYQKGFKWISQGGVAVKGYLFDQRGRTTVVSAWADWTILATSDFGEDIYATPAIADGQLFVRTNGHLYCFGTPPESH